MIVISNNTYNRKTADIVVVAMTSNRGAADYSFPITSSDLEKGALNRPGKVRADKFYALSQSTVVKTFGRVNDTTLGRIRQTLRDLTAKTPPPLDSIRTEA